MSGAAAGGAAAAAAAAAARRRQEEEELTPYTPDDLAGGWQFKILSSPFGRFGNPDYLRDALEEEARAGWTLVEKFDNTRVRLKRPATYAQQDAKLDFDPYRSTVGAKPGANQQKAILTIAAVVAVFLGFILLAALK